MTRQIYTLLLLFVPIFAFAQIDTTLYGSVDDDPRYVEMCSEHDSLEHGKESLQRLIVDARERYFEARTAENSSEQVENLKLQILNLEGELLALRNRSREVVEDITRLQQRYILNDMYDGVTKSNDYNHINEDMVEHPQLIHNSIIARSLSAGSYVDLKQAQHEDEQMPKLVEEYLATYGRINSCVREYYIATEEQEGDAIYDNYLALRDRADSLGGVIDSYWNHILNAKYYAYGYILERYGLFDLLDNSSADFSNMQQMCANEDGRYQLDALAHYALGRQTLVAFERDFAHEMGLTAAADSLQRVYDDIAELDYRLTPISVERKLFVEYEPLRFGAKDFYNDANPIPEVKVYARGTIYRVLLGTYRNRPSNTVFKGVQPLSVSVDDNGYNYYVAGFATEEEANAACEQLVAKGFKAPQVCCWSDGAMRNLSIPEPETSESVNTQTLGQRYILLLECKAITEPMRATISTVAPDKRISRRGAGFAIGTFTSRGDVEKLQKAMTENHPNVKVSIIELNIQ